MDYSAHDSDLPGGGDPWASSPQHNRQSFGQPPTTDIPSSPLPPQASPYGQGSEQYGYMGDQDAQNRPNTASENGDHSQHQQVAGQDAPQSQQHPQAQQQVPAQGQQPQRYHGTRPQRQQQHYKLQAKVTGLERNGKKDPILRFDVYVRYDLFFKHFEVSRKLSCKGTIGGIILFVPLGYVWRSATLGDCSTPFTTPTSARLTYWCTHADGVL